MGMSQGKIQGEGDYDAARRYRDGVENFVDKADVTKLAKDAMPASDKERQDIAAAEAAGRSHSRGDDPKDAGIMSSNQKPKTS
jgi:hypothetical protein